MFENPWALLLTAWLGVGLLFAAGACLFDEDCRAAFIVAAKLLGVCVFLMLAWPFCLGWALYQAYRESRSPWI